MSSFIQVNQKIINFDHIVTANYEPASERTGESSLFLTFVDAGGQQYRGAQADVLWNALEATALNITPNPPQENPA